MADLDQSERRKLLIGYDAPLGDGFALAVYGNTPNPNEIFVARARSRGDGVNIIDEFCAYASDTWVALKPVDVVAAEVGDDWPDVFVWREEYVVGAPLALWRKLARRKRDIRATAPLSYLDILLNADADGVQKAAIGARRMLESWTTPASVQSWIEAKAKERFFAKFRGATQASVIPQSAVRAIRCVVEGNVFVVTATKLANTDIAVPIRQALRDVVCLLAGFDIETSVVIRLPAASPKTEEASHISFEELADRVRAYLPTANMAALRRAYDHVLERHVAKRFGGDPAFKAHPIAVAALLAEYRLDLATIIAALLSDLVAESSLKAGGIAQEFDRDTAEVVTGVVKLSELEFRGLAGRSVAKLEEFAASSLDARVLLVKLADRLQLMRSLQLMHSTANRKLIARETHEVHIPLAEGTGCGRIRAELQDLVLQHLNPAGWEAVTRRMERERDTWNAVLAQVTHEIVARLEAAGVAARVQWREHTPYAIWRALGDGPIDFARPKSVNFFKVIVSSKDDCYRAIDAIHRAWEHVPDLFEDYILEPRPNNYRALHTTVMAEHGTQMSIVVCSEGMDQLNETGVAASLSRRILASPVFESETAEGEDDQDPMVHFRRAAPRLAPENIPWLDDGSLLEGFVNDIFVFTPRGDVICLPRGAMPLDFAYEIHSAVGDACIGSKINDRLIALRTPLSNGDTIEIIRGSKPVVPPDWKILAITKRARARIRRHIRRTSPPDEAADPKA